MKYFQLTAKGQRWARSHDCHFLIDAVFVEPEVGDGYPSPYPNLKHVQTLPIIHENDMCVAEGGGALYGGEFCDFSRNDSFYIEVSRPSWLKGPYYVGELGAHYVKTNPLYLAALKVVTGQTKWQKVPEFV